MENPVKQIKLNNLEYNMNRDPQVYRKVVNKAFDLQVKLAGSGTASVSLNVGNETLANEEVSLPGTFNAHPAFDSAGSRVGTITVNQNGETFSSYVRFDVMDHAWIG